MHHQNKLTTKCMFQWTCCRLQVSHNSQSLGLLCLQTIVLFSKTELSLTAIIRAMTSFCRTKPAARCDLVDSATVRLSSAAGLLRSGDGHVVVDPGAITTDISWNQASNRRRYRQLSTRCRCHMSREMTDACKYCMQSLRKLTN
jgi:hypothetical protein